MKELIQWEQVTAEDLPFGWSTNKNYACDHRQIIFFKRNVSQILDDRELHLVVTTEPYWQPPKEGETPTRVPDGEIQKFKEGYQYAIKTILKGMVCQ